MKTTILILSLLFLNPVNATQSHAGTQSGSELPEQDVIYLTMDGVKIDDILREWQHPDLLSDTIPYVKENGLQFGARLLDRMMISNDAALSLPGYRSMMTGRWEHDCRHNDCETITVPTLFDELPEAGIPSNKTAVFASWDMIRRAVAATPVKIEGNIDFEPLQCSDPSPGETSQAESIRQRAMAEKAEWGVRLDDYTWEAALDYLSRHEPRFTYLSFLDTDEWAHAHKKSEYRASIRSFDQHFSELRSLLAKTPGRLERTSFVISTDHGRGIWFLWGTHSKGVSFSSQVWAFVIPSASLKERFDISRARKSGLHSAQIRSTIEELLIPGSRLWEKRGYEDPLISLDEIEN